MREIREMLRIDPLPDHDPEIGRWLWALEETRRHTLETVAGLDQRALDWEGDDGRDNAIGSLLYHLALIEMDWLFEEVQEREPPPEVAADFPLEHRTADGRLARVPGVPLGEHLARLERSRKVFLDAFRGMTLDDWRRPRRPDGVDYEATPEWVVFHLVEHEAGHGFQIGAMRARAARRFGS